MARPKMARIEAGRPHRQALRPHGPARRAFSVAAYIASSLAPNTQRAYASDLRHFKKWGGSIPATPLQAAKYLAAHAKKLKVSTLIRRLAAIASAHAAIGRVSPTQSTLIRATLRGIKRVHGMAQSQAKPITLAMLRTLVRPCAEHSEVRTARDRALLLVGFAGGFRRSELVRIAPPDLIFSRSGVTVTLRRSKTDPHSRGRTVALPYGLGSLCAVKALKRWLEILRREREDAESLSLFRRVDRYGRIGLCLSDAAVGTILRDRMQSNGLPADGFSAHSLRAGLVTAAAQAGTPTWAIQRQTGHKSESTVHRYIRGISPFKMNASRSALRF